MQDKFRSTLSQSIFVEIWQELHISRMIGSFAPIIWHLRSVQMIFIGKGFISEMGKEKISH